MLADFNLFLDSVEFSLQPTLIFLVYALWSLVAMYLVASAAVLRKQPLTFVYVFYAAAALSFMVFFTVIVGGLYRFEIIAGYCALLGSAAACLYQHTFAKMIVGNQYQYFETAFKISSQAIKVGIARDVLAGASIGLLAFSNNLDDGFIPLLVTQLVVFSAVFPLSSKNSVLFYDITGVVRVRTKVVFSIAIVIASALFLFTAAGNYIESYDALAIAIQAGVLSYVVLLYKVCSATVKAPDTLICA